MHNKFHLKAKMEAKLEGERRLNGTGGIPLVKLVIETV
jgi:hypothetical protein